MFFCGLTYYPQPLSQKEIDSTDKQRHPGHHSVAKGGPKRDHQKPYPYFCSCPNCSFVLLGEEKVDQCRQYPENQKKIIEGSKPISCPQWQNICMNLPDQIARAVTDDRDPGKDPYYQCQCPSGQPEERFGESGKEQNSEGKGNQKGQIPPDKWVPQIGSEDIVILQGNPVTGRDPHIEVLGKFVKGIVLVQEAEDEQSQTCRQPRSYDFH